MVFLNFWSILVPRHCAKMGNTFCLSLSAPYVCRYFGDRILTVPGMAGFGGAKWSGFTNLTS